MGSFIAFLIVGGFVALCLWMFFLGVRGMAEKKRKKEEDAYKKAHGGLDRAFVEAREIRLADLLAQPAETAAKPKSAPSGASPAPPPKVQPQPKPKPKPESEEDRILHRIRDINDSISHPELSRKIDRIEEITRDILDYQKAHPKRSADLKKFLHYYLPTTLNLLTSYAELERQSVRGRNITETQRRIEVTMDKVVEAFERQLDKLFAGEMMDITADIAVLEQMMEQDGLTEEDAIRAAVTSPAGTDSGVGTEQVGV